MSYQFDTEMALLRQTKDAILVREAGISPADAEQGVNEFWIPKSVVTNNELVNDGDVGTLEVKTRWARKEELTDEEDDE